MKKLIGSFLIMLVLGVISCRDAKKEKKELETTIEEIETIEKEVDSIDAAIDQEAKELEDALKELDSI